MLKFRIVLFVLFVCAASLQAQTTINVPGGAPSIQSAISIASPGDTVLVAPGIYNESINFLGKDITVKSSGGVGVTIINSVGPGEDRAVTFDSGETAAAVLEGFILQGGNLSLSDVGAGILCIDSSPTVKSCVIRFNQAERDGGGVAVLSTNSSATPTFIDCMITDNTVGGPGVTGPNGGGIYIQSSGGETAHPVFERCSILRNTASTNSVGSSGGGVCLIGSGGSSVISGTFKSCLIAENDSIADLPMLLCHP